MPNLQRSALASPRLIMDAHVLMASNRTCPVLGNRTGPLCCAAHIAILFLFLETCRAGQVVFIQGPDRDRASQQEVELATRFYGLDLDVVHVDAIGDLSKTVRLARRPTTLAFIVSADALSSIPKTSFTASLLRPKTKPVPLLVLRITPQADLRPVTGFSDADFWSCRPVSPDVSPHVYMVGADIDVVHELAGQEIPTSSPPICVFPAAPAKK